MSHLQTPHLTSHLKLKCILAALASLLFLQFSWQVLSVQNTPPTQVSASLAPSLPSGIYLHEGHHLIESTQAALFKIGIASSPSSCFSLSCSTLFSTPLTASNTIGNLLIIQLLIIMLIIYCLSPPLNVSLKRAEISVYFFSLPCPKCLELCLAYS